MTTVCMMKKMIIVDYNNIIVLKRFVSEDCITSQICRNKLDFPRLFYKGRKCMHCNDLLCQESVSGHS